MMLPKATTVCLFLTTFGFVWGGTPLYLGQRIPTHSEHDSSGSISGKIVRGSSRFNNELITNYNSGIVFKDEEGTGSDRLMTPRCSDKLNELARLVKNYWGGTVKLRVTEAWDEDNEHSSSSLHYEGRAVDLTTSPVDRCKYGMLGRLAVDAGFDWVYYEAAHHVHASVKKTTTGGNGDTGGGGGGGGICFTLHSQVRTPAGDSLPMNSLKVGDRIMTVKRSGEISYSPVISFMHYDTQKTGHFVQLQTENNHAITLSPYHLIYKTDRKNINATRLPAPVFAYEVREDDYLFVVPPDAASGTSTNIPTSRVVRVGVVHEKGVIAPLTADGTIVVDSVVASCYAVTKREGLAHLSFAPLRFLYNTVPEFLPGRVEGIPWYPSMLKRLAHLVGVIDSSNNIVTREL